MSLHNAYSKILEVGPGRGMLTKYLLEKDFELFAIEADRDMVLYLQKYYPELKKNLIEADFLKVDLAQVLPETSFALIGNFPYNISSQILFKLLEYRMQIPEMVGMFQKEVAQRVIAVPGNKTYGIISVLVQAFYDGTYLFTVEKGSFSPPPKVQSGVIRLTRKANQTLACNEVLFRKVVKQAFSQRRKMLRNTMKTFLKENPILKTTFFQKRPEVLSVQDFVELTNTIDQINS